MIDDNVAKFIEKNLPKKDLLTAKDLMQAGLARSTNTLCNWRMSGKGPKFLQLTNKMVRYTRDDVIEWVINSARRKKKC